MKWVRRTLIALVIIPVVAAALLWLASITNYVSGSWRYKTTVTVETPEGIKTGFAVREVSNSISWLEQIFFLDIPNVTSPAEVEGEAVVVDLGERGQLFALLKGYKHGEDYAHSILYDLFSSPSGATTPEGIKFYDRLTEGGRILRDSEYPVLVTFKDLKDPKTVALVLDVKPLGSTPKDGFKIEADHFEELFGKGVRLKQISIEMTDEPITWNMEQWLSWLPEYYNKMLDGRIIHLSEAENKLANSLASGSFSTGKN